MPLCLGRKERKREKKGTEPTREKEKKRVKRKKKKLVFSSSSLLVSPFAPLDLRLLFSLSSLLSLLLPLSRARSLSSFSLALRIRSTLPLLLFYIYRVTSTFFSGKKYCSLNFKISFFFGTVFFFFLVLVSWGVVKRPKKICSEDDWVRCAKQSVVFHSSSPSEAGREGKGGGYPEEEKKIIRGQR